MRTARVVQAVRRFMTGRPAGPGVVAVSGGADSVALVRALAAAGTGPLTVGHVNHLLRGAESDADERFVGDLAGALGVGFRSTRVDVAAAAAGANLEATARRVRYDWLAGVAADVGASWVATGHTADDQAETVLHRLVRGTGLQGLRGIAAAGRIEGSNPPTPFPKRDGGAGPSSSPLRFGEGPGERLPRPNPPTPFPKREGVAGTGPSSSPLRFGEGPGEGLSRSRLPLLRPLLSVTRAEIVEFLASLDQPFREDASNADPRFTRNRIRAELVPLLKRFNPAVVTVLGHLAEQAAETHDLVAGLARTFLEQAEKPRAGEIVILDAAALAATPALVVRSALRLVWEREGWPMGEMGHDQWAHGVAVAHGRAGGWDFPGGVSARARGRVVQIGRRE